MVITWGLLSKTEREKSSERSCLWCKISAVSKYVKLPALLGTGYFFSCSLHFFCSFLKRESARITSKVRVSCRGEATSQSWSSLTVSQGLAGGEGGEGPKEKVPHQRGQVQGPGHRHRHRLLGGGGSINTHYLFPSGNAWPSLLPQAGAHWRHGTLRTYQGRPLTASRNYLRRRDFWVGNGPSPTGCQQGWEEGRESHIWESISRKPSWGGGRMLSWS